MENPSGPNDRAIYFVHDDADILRHATTTLRDSGFDVSPFDDIDDFFDACTARAPGCVILDAHFRAIAGPVVQVLLRQRGVRAPVLFLTGQSDVAIAVEMMKLGAADLILDPFNAGRLIRLVADALAADAQHAAANYSHAETLRRFKQLTPREQDVCRQTACGAANKQVARNLGISERTVEVYRARVMTKMNAQTLADLVLMYADCLHDERQALALGA